MRSRFFFASGSRQARKCDRDTHIGADFANSTRKVFVFIFGIAPRIDQHDKATAAKHHLIKCQVLEVPAIGQVDIPRLVGGAAERLR
jgi:hypothetical protein